MRTKASIILGHFMPVVVSGLVGYTYYVFVIMICDRNVRRLVNSLLREQKRTGQAIVYLVIFNALTVMVAWSYARVVLRGPGRPEQPPKPVPSSDPMPALAHMGTGTAEDADASAASEGATSQTIPTPFTVVHYPGGTPPTPPASNAYNPLQPMENALIKEAAAATAANAVGDPSIGQNVPPAQTHQKQRQQMPDSIMIAMPSTFVSKRNGGLRWCDICNYVKPDRCHHCSECDKCVLKMDHHCPWVNGCVGYYNYKFFFLFIVYTSLYADFALAATLPVMVRVLQDSKMLNIQWILLLVLALLFGMLLTGFTLVHATYILNNRTTIESISFRTRQYHVRVHFDANNPVGFGVSTTQPGENLWDLGWRQNWISVMGRRWYLWFVPVGNPPGDGLVYPYNPKIRNRLVQDAQWQLQLQEDRMAFPMQQVQIGQTQQQPA